MIATDAMIATNETIEYIQLTNFISLVLAAVIILVWKWWHR